MMADNQLFNDDGDGVGGDGDIFVYTGGRQRVPRDVKRVRIAENVDAIPGRYPGVFEGCEVLIEVEGHNKIKKIGKWAFNRCRRLRRVSKMTGLIEIGDFAFSGCHALSDVDFDKLEIIGQGAFGRCWSLESISMASIRRVGPGAFAHCAALTDLVFVEKLETIEKHAFLACTFLRRIAIPLKDNLIADNEAFDACDKLLRVDTLDGEIHETISSLHMENWRVEMEREIDRINQTLPNIPAIGKTVVIQGWIDRVLQRMEHYKSEHKALLKEAMTLLELALWKTKLLNETDERKCKVDKVTKKAKIDAEAARKQYRVTCGASIVIKNVLPFLALK